MCDKIGDRIYKNLSEKGNYSLRNKNYTKTNISTRCSVMVKRVRLFRAFAILVYYKCPRREHEA